MPVQRIAAGGNHTFLAGTIAGDATLEDTNGVGGTVIYQIGAAPQVTVPLGPRDPDITLPVNGLQFVVINNLNGGTLTVAYA